ncbi:MAG: LamG-like jellyroll fold domain-containing protein [Flavobacteriales bacterium]
MKTLKTFLLTSLVVLGLKGVTQPGSGKVLDFNGTSTYLSCGSMNLSGGQITIQAWINVDAFKSAFPYISSIAGTEVAGSSTALLRLGDASLANNKLQFVLYNGSTHYKLDGVTALSANKWYHVAATYDGSTMKIYVNGILDSSVGYSFSIVSNDDFAIARNYGNDRILDGEIDEVSVWNSALTQSTLRDWMCKSITSQHPNYSSIKGYWPMNEGSGTSAANAAGSSNNGTFVGAPSWGNSGAPIGNDSRHAYASTYSLGLSHPQGDSLNITHTSGTVQGAHLYRVDTMHYYHTPQSPIQFFDTTHYWGAFIIGTSSYAIDYDYNGNAMISNNDECNLAYASRNDGSSTSWTSHVPNSINFSANTTGWNGSNTKEFIVGISSQGPHTISYIKTKPTCVGDNDGVLTANVSGGTPPYSFTWSSGSALQTASGLASGYHYVTITDNNGCQSTDSVLLNDPPLLGASFTVTPTSCAFINDGSITANPGGGSGSNYTFLWDDANGSTTQTLSNVVAGTYNVTITDGNGCTASYGAEVPSTGPDPIVDLGSDTSLCEGGTVTLIPTLTNSSLSTYDWSTGSQSPNISVTNSGTYYLTVTNGAGCTGVDSVVVTFLAPVAINLGNNATGTGSYTINAGSGFSAYSWSNGKTGQSIVVTKTGNYTVTAIDSNGCSSVASIHVTIIPTGINETNPDLISYWPNPVKDILNINCPTGSTIELFDLTGRLIQSNVTIRSQGEIYTNSINPGKYIIRVRSDENVFTGTFVKQ